MVRYSLSCMTLSFTTPRRFIPTHHKIDPRPSTFQERMKIMVNHSNVSVREQTPHLSAVIKRRAQSLINDKTIDGPSRAIIRYGLEINDPWLPELVRRVDAGETIVDNLHVISDDEEIQTLVALICRAGDEPQIKSGALLVLMANLEESPHPKVLANTANTSRLRTAVNLTSIAW